MLGRSDGSTICSGPCWTSSRLLDEASTWVAEIVMGGSGINVDGVRMMPEVFATLCDCSGTLRVRSSRPGGELGGRGRDRGGEVDSSVARGIAGLDNVLLVAGIVDDGVATAIEGAIVEMG